MPTNPKEYEILDATITGCGKAHEDPKNNNFVIISWSSKGIGFGELTIVQNKAGGAAIIDSECMSREFCKAVLMKLVDEAKFKDEPEPAAVPA